MSAVTESTYIRARPGVGISTSQPIRFRSRWALCFRSELNNLLAGGKCLGVTHMTNGCYRLHPVEWNVGEAAGALAAFCLEQQVSPRGVRSTPACADFQRILVSMGVQLHWPEEIQTTVR